MSRGRRWAIALVAIVLGALLVVQLPPVRTVLITASIVPEMLDLGFDPLGALAGEPDPGDGHVRLAG